MHEVIALNRYVNVIVVGCYFFINMDVGDMRKRLEDALLSIISGKRDETKPI